MTLRAADSAYRSHGIPQIDRWAPGALERQLAFLDVVESYTEWLAGVFDVTFRTPLGTTPERMTAARARIGSAPCALTVGRWAVWPEEGGMMDACALRRCALTGSAHWAPMVPHRHPEWRLACQLAPSWWVRGEQPVGYPSR